MEKNTSKTLTTNFGLLFELLSRVVARPKDELVHEVGASVLNKTKNPAFLFAVVPEKRRKKCLRANRLEQAAIIARILKAAHQDPTFQTTKTERAPPITPLPSRSSA